MNDDADGYYAIILPDRGAWQGFFLNHEFDFRAGRYVESLDPGLDSIGAEIDAGQAFAHLSNREQVVARLLSTLVADHFANREVMQAMVGASAIARLSGHRFFWVEGRWLPSGHFRTTLDILEAETVLDAQLEIVELPAVHDMIHREAWHGNCAARAAMRSQAGNPRCRSRRFIDFRTGFVNS